MRVDVNVSVHSKEISGPRVEVKNVAGAKNVERALEYEYLRHIDVLSKGGTVHKETRRYDADVDVTVPLRFKDEEPDYRFFQDPDLPQIRVRQERIEAVKEKMVDTPFEAKKKFMKEFSMNVTDVSQVFKFPWGIEFYKYLVHTNEINSQLAFKW